MQLDQQDKEDREDREDKVDNEIILPRKRGRPRKNKIINKPYKEKIEKDYKIIKENENREIILHLPLFPKMNPSPDSEKNAFTMDESQTNIEVNDESILTISDQDSIKSDNINQQNIDMHFGELITELKKKNKIIKQMKEEISILRQDRTENAFLSCHEIKTIPMNISFIDNKNGKQIICEKTNIVCWWCTYNFDTLPCFIPERYSDGVFYVFGCFCSFNCALAYNLNLNDYKVPDRYSLIKKLYLLIKGTNDEILVAPPREILEKFGGHVSINEYRRKLCNITKEYKLLLPPITNLLVSIEEKTKDKEKIKSIPDSKHTSEKKIIHNIQRLNIIDTIGIKEKQ